MRLFEFLNCLLTLPLIAAMLLARPTQRGLRILCILLLAALIVHLVHEGAHWQMAPVYLAECILLAVVFAGLREPSIGIHLTGWVCLLLVILAGVFSFLLPMFRLPKPTGRYVVGTRILFLTDPNRKDEYGLTSSGYRELVVQAWYPAEPSHEPLATYRRFKETTMISSYQAVLRTHSYLDAAMQSSGAPYPVLLFNPAWTGQRTQSTFLMEELASHGFVVVSIDHTYYSGRVAFPDGRVIDARFAPDIGNFQHSTVDEQDALGSKYVRIESEDDMFVLDQLQTMNQDPASPFYQRMDMKRVGALGHSLGGAAAAEACLLDARIQVALNMDGWMFGEAGRVGLSKPLMLMYETREQEKLSASSTEADRRYWQMVQRDTARMDATLHKNGGYRIFIQGTSHWNFSDRALYSPLRRWTDAGTIAPQRGYQIIDRYVLAYFSHYLKGTTEPILDQAAREYPEVEFERWTYNSGSPTAAAVSQSHNQ